MPDIPPTPSADSPAPRNGRKRTAIGVFLVVLAATAVSGFAYWKYRQTHVSTDDAYVDGRIHMVSPRIQGTVVEVRVEDNQRVRAGELLLLIDPVPFAVRESAAVRAEGRTGASSTWRSRPTPFCATWCVDWSAPWSR